MQRTRIERKPRRPKQDRSSILPLTLRDPDVTRAKAMANAFAETKRRA